MASKGVTKPKSESITFRIEKTLLDKLRQESEQKQVSTNTLASQIFRQHINWHANAAKAGMIPVHRNFIIKLIDQVDEFAIVQLAEYAVKNEIKDIILLIRREYNPSTFLDAIKSWLEVSGFPYRHEVKNGEHSYVIQHDMGKKWSLYLAKIVQYVFQELLSQKPKTEVTANTLAFKISIEGEQSKKYENSDSWRQDQ